VLSLYFLLPLFLPVPFFPTLCRRRRKMKFEFFRVRRGKEGQESEIGVRIWMLGDGWDREGRLCGIEVR